MKKHGIACNMQILAANKTTFFWQLRCYGSSEVFLKKHLWQSL